MGRLIRNAALCALIPLSGGLFVSCAGALRDIEVMSANAAASRGSYNEAIAGYLRALRSLPDDPWIEYDLANAFLLAGEGDKAIPLFEEAAKSGDTALAALAAYGKGCAFYGNEKYAEAYDAFREALELNPGDEDAKRNIELSNRKKPKDRNDNAASVAPVQIDPGDPLNSAFDFIRKKEIERWKSHQTTKAGDYVDDY